MTTKNLNICTSKKVKQSVEQIFNEFGLNMMTAINMFLRQTICDNRIALELKLKPNAEMVAAIQEGRQLAKDSSVQGYKMMDDLKRRLQKVCGNVLLNQIGCWSKNW